ncbi:hypothetical protein BC937DRAFT_95582 [Endogone sp. FLAS-F59071]|nr:hypothetical protein BC937DRAFT_95582 [Endogone sp. FLAS-F59071]|eukprot:RUS20267.1 hypothetical protein BC937DRAFT_95582 [Endogone sp. FLAS-F59071]
MNNTNGFDLSKPPAADSFQILPQNQNPTLDPSHQSSPNAVDLSSSVFDKESPAPRRTTLGPPQRVERGVVMDDPDPAQGAAHSTLEASEKEEEIETEFSTTTSRDFSVSPDVSRSTIDLTSGYLQGANSSLQRENARLIETIKSLREDLSRAHANRQEFELKMQLETDDRIRRMAGEKMGRLERELSAAITQARVGVQGMSTSQKAQALEREVLNLKMDKELLEEDFERRSTELMRRLQEAEKPKPLPPPPKLPDTTTIATQTDLTGPDAATPRPTSAPRDASTLEQQSEEFQGRMEILLSENEDLAKEIEDLTAGKAELERELEHIETDAAAAATRRAQVAVRVSEEREALATLTREEEALRVERDEIGRRVEETRTEIQKLLRDEEAVMRRKKEEHRRVAEEKAQLEKHTRHLSKMVDELLGDRRMLERRFDSNIMGMATDVGVEDEEEGAFESVMRGSARFEVVDENREEIGRLRNLLEQTQEERERLTEEKERIESALGKKSRIVEETEMEIGGLRRRVREMEDAMGRMRTELEGRSREIARLQELVRRAAIDIEPDKSTVSVTRETREGEEETRKVREEMQVNTSVYTNTGTFTNTSVTSASAAGDYSKQTQHQLSKMTKAMNTAKKEIADLRDEVSRVKTENLQLRSAVQATQSKSTTVASRTGAKTSRKPDANPVSRGTVTGTSKATAAGTTANKNNTIVTAYDADNPDAAQLQLEEQILQLEHKLDEALAECDRLRSQLAQTRKEPVTKIPKRWSGSGGSGSVGAKPGVNQGKDSKEPSRDGTPTHEATGEKYMASPVDMVAADEHNLYWFTGSDGRAADVATLRALQSQISELRTQLDEANAAAKIEQSGAALRFHEVSAARRRAEERIADLEGMIEQTEKSAVLLKEEMARKQREVDDLKAWKREQLRRRESLRIAMDRDRSNMSFEDHVEDALQRNLETVRTIDELCNILVSQTPKKRRGTPRAPAPTPQQPVGNVPLGRGNDTQQNTPTPISAHELLQMLPPQTPNQVQSTYQTPEQTPTKVADANAGDAAADADASENLLTDLHLVQIMQGLLNLLRGRIQEIVILVESEDDVKQKGVEAYFKKKTTDRRPAKLETQLNFTTPQKQTENRKLNAGHTPGPKVVIGALAKEDRDGQTSLTSPTTQKRGKIVNVCDRTIQEMDRLGGVLKEYVDGNLDEAIEAGEAAEREGRRARGKEEEGGRKRQDDGELVRRDMKDLGGKLFFLQEVEGEWGSHLALALSTVRFADLCWLYPTFLHPDKARDELKKEIEKLREVLLLQNQTIVDYQATINSLRENKEENEVELQKIRETVARFVDAWSPLEAAGVEPKPVLQEQLQELKDIWQNESMANTSLRNHVKELKATTTSREEENRQQIATLATQVKLLNDHLLSTKSVTDEYETKWRETESALIRERREHEARVAGFTRQEAELQRDLTEISNRSSEELASVKSELARVRDTHQKEVMQTKERMEELTRQHASQIEQLKQSHQAEERRLFQAKKDVEGKAMNAKQELRKANDKIMELEAEIEEGQQRIRQLTQEKTAWAKEKQRLQSEINSTSEELEALRQNHPALADLEGKLMRLKNEKQVLAEQHAQRVQELEKDAQASLEKIMTLTKEKGNAIREKSEMSRKCATLNGERELAEAEVKAERESIQKLHEESKTLMDGLATERRNHRATYEQGLKIESELKDLREQQQRALKEMEEAKEAIEQKKEECNALYEEMKNLQALGKQMSKAGAELQLKNNSLRNELVVARSQFQDALSAAQDQIKALKDLLQDQLTQQRTDMHIVNTKNEDVLRQEITLLREQQAELNVSARKGQLSVEVHTRLHNEVQRQLEEKEQTLRASLIKGGIGKRSGKEPDKDRLGSDENPVGGDEIDITKLKAELAREKKRHNEQVKEFAREARYLRAKFHRECGFRADLGYQKKYLLLLIGGLESCDVDTHREHGHQGAWRGAWNERGEKAQGARSEGGKQCQVQEISVDGRGGNEDEDPQELVGEEQSAKTNSHHNRRASESRFLVCH